MQGEQYVRCRNVRCEKNKGLQIRLNSVGITFKTDELTLTRLSSPNVLTQPITPEDKVVTSLTSKITTAMAERAHEQYKQYKDMLQRSKTWKFNDPQ